MIIFCALFNFTKKLVNLNTDLQIRKFPYQRKKSKAVIHQTIEKKIPVSIIICRVVKTSSNLYFNSCFFVLVHKFQILFLSNNDDKK